MAISSNKWSSYSLIVITIVYAVLYYHYAATLDSFAWKLTSLYPGKYIQQLASIKYFAAYLLLCFICMAQKLIFFSLGHMGRSRPAKEIFLPIFAAGLIFYFLTPFIAITFQSFMYSIDWGGNTEQFATQIKQAGLIFVMNCLFIGTVYDLCFLRFTGGDREMVAVPLPGLPPRKF